jgi:putative tricarboxylic transport membrane protein
VRLSDYSLAALFAALAGYVAITAWGFPTMPGMRVGPGLFPIALSIALAIACAVLALQARARTAPATETAPAAPGAPRRVIALAGSCGVFGLGGVLGFVPATALALGWLMQAFGVRWRFAVPFAIFFAVVVDIVFVRVLRIPLPLGAWGGWF